MFLRKVFSQWGWGKRLTCLSSHHWLKCLLIDITGIITLGWKEKMVNKHPQERLSSQFQNFLLFLQDWTTKAKYSRFTLEADLKMQIPQNPKKWTCESNPPWA